MMVTLCIGDSKLIEEVIRDIIAIEILRFMREDFSGLITPLRDELISVMDEQLWVLQADLGKYNPTQ